MATSLFGILDDGTSVHAVDIGASLGPRALRARVLTLGATIAELHVPDVLLAHACAHCVVSARSVGA